MKRIFVLLNLFAAGFCFGQAGHWSLELAGGYSAYSIENDGEFTSVNGYSFGMSGIIFAGDNLGVGMYVNFVYLPQIGGTNLTRMAVYETVAENVIKNGGDNSLSGFDFLMGPTFMLYNSDKIKVPFTIGCHVYGFTAVTEKDLSGLKNNRPSGLTYFPLGYYEKIDYTEVNCGLGFNISLEWHFSKQVYLLGRIQGGGDFINYHSKEETRKIWAESFVRPEDWDIGWSNAWGIMPQLGIGVRF